MSREIRLLLALAVTRSLRVVLVVPELMPVKVILCNPAPTLRTRLLTGSNVGNEFVELVFTALSVMLKVRVTMLLLAPPSLTVTVMTAVPTAFVTGANVNVPVVYALV
jgi:hypothetical protein